MDDPYERQGDWLRGNEATRACLQEMVSVWEKHKGETAARGVFPSLVAFMAMQCDDSVRDLMVWRIFIEKYKIREAK